MLNNYIKLLFLVCFSLFVFDAKAQNYIINPATDGGFEGSAGWTIVNHPTAQNSWIIGTAVKTDGTYGAYVSNSASTQAITSPQNTNSAIYLYKDVVVPANASTISLSFKFKNPINTTNPPRVFFAKTSEFRTILSVLMAVRMLLCTKSKLAKIGETLQKLKNALLMVPPS
jgi:hypothetical protein